MTLVKNVKPANVTPSRMQEEETPTRPASLVQRQLPTGIKAGEMFLESFHFDPTSTITLEDVVDILRVMDIAFSAEPFERLKEKTKKQFIRRDRYGANERYRKPRS